MKWKNVRKKEEEDKEKWEAWFKAMKLFMATPHYARNLGLENEEKKAVETQTPQLRITWRQERKIS